MHPTGKRYLLRYSNELRSHHDCVIADRIGDTCTIVRILMVNGNAITVEILVIKHELARYFASDDLINDLK